MPRTANPNYCLDQMQSVMAELAEFRGRVDAVHQEANLDRSDRKRFAELVLLAMGAEMEAFLTDWVVASINRAPKAFHDDSQRRAADSVHSKMPWIPRASVSIDFPSLKLQEVKDAITENGFNLPFADYATFLERYLPRLGGLPKQRLETWTEDDCWVLDLVKFLRNYIAHRNEMALERLNDHLLAVRANGPFTFLGRAQGSHKVRDPGKYLISRMGDQSRFERIEIGSSVALGKLRI